MHVWEIAPGKSDNCSTDEQPMSQSQSVYWRASILYFYLAKINKNLIKIYCVVISWMETFPFCYCLVPFLGFILLFLYFRWSNRKFHRIRHRTKRPIRRRELKRTQNINNQCHPFLLLLKFNIFVCLHWPSYIYFYLNANILFNIYMTLLFSSKNKK